MFNKITKAPPRCPLCLKPMEHEWDLIRKVDLFVCQRDEVKIQVMDPLVGRWEEKREKIPCPNCGTNMRVFFNSAGFMKAKCPSKKCGCAVRTMNVSADTKGGQLPGALKTDGMAHS